MHEFINGEIRTDGWKSEWRREQERRRAEEMGKRFFVRMPEIKIVRRQTRKDRPSRARTPGFTRLGVPSGMNNVEYGRYRRSQWRAQGLCGSCGGETANGLYSCASCLERKASYYCKRMGKPYVMKKVEPRFCKVCEKLLNANNIYGHCRTHYKQKRRELARAA